MAVRVTNQIKVVDKGWDDIYTDIKKLDEAYTKVGFPENGTVQGGGEANSISEVARIATFQEYGVKQKATPKQARYLSSIGFPIRPGATITLPRRAFMSTSWDENKEAIVVLSQKKYGEVIDQKIQPVMALRQLGAFGEGLIKKKITSIKTPKNHPFTIKRKGSSNPLIDTGQMRATVTHKEVMK